MDKQEKPDKSLLEEMVDDIIIRMDNMENQEIKITDYKQQFESLENLIRSSLTNNNHHLSHNDLTKFFEQQKIVSEQIQTQISEVKDVVTTMPKSIPVKHSIDIKAKGITIVIASVFVILACLSGYCFHLYNKNERLEANDIKYRAIRRTAPKWTNWADTTYARNPEAMVNNTAKLEDQALEQAEAHLIAKDKEDQARTAKKRLKDLKKKK